MEGMQLTHLLWGFIEPYSWSIPVDANLEKPHQANILEARTIFSIDPMTTAIAETLREAMTGEDAQILEKWEEAQEIAEITDDSVNKADPYFFS